MKNFIFESISFLSSEEKKAKTIHFHPKKNLLVGENHTGKSTVIKNLFLTLGAHPEGNLSRWNPAYTNLVKFSFKSSSYTAILHNGLRALYDSNDQLLFSANSHKKWTEFFSKFLEFNLILTNKKSESVIADSRCFFLPFYINQDGSWNSSWDTFKGMQQYKAPAKNILEYFSGLRPSKYYELISRQNALTTQFSILQGEMSQLERVKSRFKKSVDINSTKLDETVFRREIDELTASVNILNNKQQKIREQYVRENELIDGLKCEIKLANSALKVYDVDAKYLEDHASEPLLCPTCGAEHTDNFYEALTYSEDARVLREMTSKLQLDLTKLEDQHSLTKNKLNELNANYSEINQILSRKKGDLKFGEIVSNLGSESALKTFNFEYDLLKGKIDEISIELGTYALEIKELTNKNRSKEILEIFRNSYTDALNSLNMAGQIEPKSLTGRPKISGSGGPRSLLAYYSALWETCFSKYGEYLAPVVIDAPQQQGQDNLNLPKILKFISSDLPNNCQVIVGVEINSDFHFDNKIFLTAPYQLLNADDYQEVADMAEPFMKSLAWAELSRNEGS